MKSELFKALKLTLILVFLFSGVYTFMVYGAAQLFRGKGRGEKTKAGGKEYYTNIGQSFVEDRYFQGRPSANAYRADGSGGSNKGPSNTEYLAAVQGRVDTFLEHNPGIMKAQIPVELVTASGSGLDPDLSVKAAMVQVKRVAAVRNIPEATVAGLVRKQAQKPLLGMFGPAKINVLQLNLALDQIHP